MSNESDFWYGPYSEFHERLERRYGKPYEGHAAYTHFTIYTDEKAGEIISILPLGQNFLGIEGQINEYILNANVSEIRAIKRFHPQIVYIFKRESDTDNAHLEEKNNIFNQMSDFLQGVDMSWMSPEPNSENSQVNTHNFIEAVLDATSGIINYNTLTQALEYDNSKTGRNLRELPDEVHYVMDVLFSKVNKNIASDCILFMIPDPADRDEAKEKIEA